MQGVGVFNEEVINNHIFNFIQMERQYPVLLVFSNSFLVDANILLLTAGRNYMYYDVSINVLFNDEVPANCMAIVGREE